MPRLALASLTLVLTLTHALPAADWPRFRGPDGSGISTEKGLPTEWSKTENIAWKTDLPGAGASSPVFFGDRIFLTAWTGFAVPGQPGGSESDLRFHLLRLDRKTGKLQWDKEIAGKGAVKKPSRDGEGFASSTPAVDAERVYCYFGTSGLFAFDHAGKQLWQADVGNRAGDWVSAASPVLYGDLVIINGSIEGDSMAAFDKATGKEKWRVKNIRQAWNTPLVVKNKAGKDELVVVTQPKVLAFDPATGAALWNCNTDITWYIVPSAVAHDGVVYALGGRSGVIGLAVRTGGSGDVTRTHRLWTSKKGSNVSSPVFHDGHLYWMNDASGTAYCAKADTGEVVYEQRVPRAGGVYASALLADGKIYYVGREGRTYVLAAKPEYELLATNDLSDRSNFDATPVATDGRLFIRSNKALYCVEKK
jgi:outer membrane protein assembly factor BamB